ncbi:MAG: SDR family oxidoreductase [Phocaeicola sp.]|uniref:SDR family NAD(P)-dependent oxidoreductase n=1 Tax=Phocaeicola sp. TaxID=2773926 RepID=UPI0023C0EB23|nr:SDR family oxidoreductase [Phocaeicola sp.]MDE5678156.1 SDR family oxidoreductase [Phocaeicola sp.]MDE6181402.1 SDR family oxidoreductase [Phocaeicola sp.]
MAFTIDLTGKVVLITGVSSGIGFGTAREFARAGACVAGCSRKDQDDESVSSFLQVVKECGSNALYIQADVTHKEDLEKMVQKVIDTFGRLDIVVSNAGMNVFEGAEGCTEERWAYNLDLNLASHWRLAKLCKPYLQKSGEGVLLLMTSNHAFCSIPGCFPYNVTKTAITGLVRSLTIEWGPEIRTVGVAPGFIDTAGNDTWFNSFPDAMAERQRTINLHPVKRIGTVEEVGALCVYLASPMACFISGTTILMDGGRSALMQDSY